MNWYIKVIKNYAEFSGRARRTEYWMFFLFDMIFTFIASILDTIVFGAPSVFLFLYTLFTIIPFLAVTVRRLHDTNRSGWYYFVQLIPFIGVIWYLILLCLEGTNGPNSYGEDPKNQEMYYSA
ncbi:DUF805 domain-containing protein [Natronospora cellulosivora (SeqCode)]